MNAPPVFTVSRLFRRMDHRLLRVFRAAASLCSALLTAGAEGPLVKSFDIPAGDAALTLKRFVSQSGEQVVFLVDRVRGVITHPVQGDYTPRAALERMISNTDLRVVEDEESGALVIHRRPARSGTEPGPAPPPSPPPRGPPPAPPAAGSGAPTSDVLVKLPTFTTNSERDASYVGREALSTTRTGVSLADLPQSVIVLNQAFLTDVNPTILAKALTYVGGAQTGTINWSVDRYMIRGFVGEGDYVDGFRTQTDKNTDLNLVDHVEIIKGPSAIFIANQANTVGGVINKISKSPTDYRVAALTIQAGLWDSNRADLDLSGPVTADKRLLYRLLVAAQESDGYYEFTHEKRRSIVPMLAYRFSRDTEAWLKFEAFTSRYSSYNGLPLDGRTNQLVEIPWKRNLGEDRPRNWRSDRFWRLWGQFTSRLSDHVAIRIAAFDSVDRQRRVESIPIPTGGSIADGVLTPQYVIPPDHLLGQLVPRGTTAVSPDDQPRREVQGDIVFNFSTGPASHKLLVGCNLIDYPQRTSTYSSGPSSTAYSSPIDPFSPGRAGEVRVDFSQPATNHTEKSQSFAKVYALETASFLNNRVIVSFGGSRNRFAFSQASIQHNQLTGVTDPVVRIPEQRMHRNLVQYGLVLKPLPNVSFFYGYNKNFSSNGLSATNALLPPQEGEQKEIGIKAEWLGGRVAASLNHFDVVQLNNSVPAYPQTSPPSFALVTGAVSRGFDGDFCATLGRNLDLIGSFAFFDAYVPLPDPWQRIRHPHDQRTHPRIDVNNASECNFSLWARYKFPQQPLRGWSLGVGVNRLARRAITDNNNQVLYGYLPPRTLVDATLAYDTGRAKYQLNLDNVFGSDHVYAARSNQILVPGTPLNVRLLMTLRF